MIDASKKCSSNGLAGVPWRQTERGTAQKVGFPLFRPRMWIMSFGTQLIYAVTPTP